MSVPEIAAVISAACNILIIPAVRILWQIERRIFMLEINAGIAKNVRS